MPLADLSGTPMRDGHYAIGAPAKLIVGRRFSPAFVSIDATHVVSDTDASRAKALHYRRVAALVSDEAVAKALLELAAEYTSLADMMEESEPNP